MLAVLGDNILKSPRSQTEESMQGLTFWIIQIPGWALFVYLVAAQCTAALSYSLGVRMGTQEPRENVTDVGVAFWKGYAGADLIFYTPILGLGLLGQIAGTRWADAVLAAALGVTVYWPIACLWTVRAARGASGWHLSKEAQYWLVLPIIAGWGLVGLILVSLDG